MTKIDLKDRKILYHLDLDCRQSNTQIGKKVGLKRDVVAYRINRMQDEGIINNYWTLIDTFQLGYNVFRMYINFQYVTSQIKEEIINYFINNKYSWIVGSVKSEIDLGVVTWVNNIYDFYRFWDKTLDLYEDYFEKYAISIYSQVEVYKKSFLLPDDSINSDRLICNMYCGRNAVEIDKTDYKLLNEIATNARAPLIDLADKLNISSQSIRYRIKNLEKTGVIKGFRVNLDLSKLDLHHYKVDIYLKDHKLKKSLIEFLAKKPYVEYMNMAIGWADLEPEFVVKDFDELNNILDKINEKYSGVIKKQSFFIIDNLYKLRCLPELY